MASNFPTAYVRVASQTYVLQHIVDFHIGKMIVLQVEKYGSIWNECFLFFNNNYSAITPNSESVTTIVMFSLHRERAAVSITTRLISQ